MGLPDEREQPPITASQQEWLRIRKYLTQHRYDLALRAADDYPADTKVNGTPLLAAKTWIPSAPIALKSIQLEYRVDVPFSGVTGAEPAAESTLPTKPDGSRYGYYSDAVADLAAPRVFQNRSTYRLVEADLGSGQDRLVFGRGTYFDGINIGEACAHEYAASILADSEHRPLREEISDPCDPALRLMNLAISTLTVRHDRTTGSASFFLHWRDPAKVGHAGGLYQVLPVGIFQASSDEPWNESNDFSLWRCMVREFAEELLGESEEHGSNQAPIDYDAWPFAAQLTAALAEGRVRAYYLGMGVDPLTFATDMLTVAVFDAGLFDDLFGKLVTNNDEGQVLGTLDSTSTEPGIAFTAENVERFIHREPMQAAGAALLALAWQHRGVLLA